MKFPSLLVAIFSVCAVADAFVPRSRPALVRGGGSGLPMSTTEKTEGKKAPKDAPPTHLGWDTHKAVVSWSIVKNQEAIYFTRAGGELIIFALSPE
jgi:hypothetical protein